MYHVHVGGWPANWCPLDCSDNGLASGGQPVAELASCDSATAASSSTHLAVSIRGLLVQFDDPAVAMGCCPIHGDGARGGASSQSRKESCEVGSTKVSTDVSDLRQRYA